MNLSIRYFKDVAGNNMPALCDENGVALPCQTATQLNFKAGELSTLTVTFMLDNHAIKFVAEPATE